MVDKNSLYQRGMAGIVPVNPLAPETVERQIDQILEEIFMEEKSREFAKEVMCLISIQHRFFHQMKRDYLFSIMI